MYVLYVSLRLFAEAIQWCDEGLKVHPTGKRLLGLRAAADKQKVQALMSSVDFCVEVLISVWCNVYLGLKHYQCEGPIVSVSPKFSSEKRSACLSA